MRKATECELTQVLGEHHGSRGRPTRAGHTRVGILARHPGLRQLRMRRLGQLMRSRRAARRADHAEGGPTTTTS
jgi:hypothetical protein